MRENATPRCTKPKRMTAALLSTGIALLWCSTASTQDQRAGALAGGQSDFAVRASFDGYMYLAIAKRLDMGDIAGAKSIANEAIRSKVSELDQIKPADLSAEVRNSAQLFVKRAREYQNALPQHTE